MKLSLSKVSNQKTRTRAATIILVYPLLRFGQDLNTSASYQSICNKLERVKPIFATN